MKKLILATMAITATLTSCGDQSANPLLGEFNTPHNTPPFEQIKLEHYIPAFKEGIREQKEEVDAIIANPEEPTFENTIEALDRTGKLLNRTAGIFFPLNSSETSPEMDEIANEIQPLLTAHSNDISLNEKLFERVKAVYDYYYDKQWEVFPLNKEQTMLLNKTYKGFSRNGAALSEADKEIYRDITTELSGLTLKFGQNVLAATNAFSLNIPPADEAKIAYMPDFVKAGMAEEAKSRGEEGWTVTLQAPSMIPFMTYSKERDLKEIVWKASNSKCYGGEYDNTENIKRIAELRLRLANLLGYDTYADYVLEERMANSRTIVDNFLKELLLSTKELAQQDYNNIVAFSQTLPEAPEQFMPWDFGYFDEMYKTAKYDLNDEQVKPYMQLENVVDATFAMATKLFGLKFTENPEIQVYHPDVQAYEVNDADGKFLGILYMDYFPRAGKRPGAWMTNFRDASIDENGNEIRPFVSLNFNFTKPTGDTPALLTFDELITVLHEFGHGLHGMLAEGTYESLTGTSVYRDFVELPSQLLENWATEREFLDMFAVHYQTGEKIPAELVARIVATKSYLEPYRNVRQLSFGMNDMAWHSITEPYTGDISAFERNATSATQILPVVDGMCMAPSFSHIFAGGYAAGYYSYKWSEVLEADAFSLFREKGIFNKDVADSYRENILSKGGSEHPMDLYVRFRGHEPDTKALINKIKGI